MSEIVSFWRRTPPALFPACLGLLGLGMAWRHAGVEPISVALITCGLIVFLTTFVSYSAKVLARPSVLAEELLMPPARAGVAAGSMCWMLVAAVVSPLNAQFGLILWVFSLVLHLVYLQAVINAVVKAKMTASQVLPPMLLPFVGYIVAALCGAEVGFSTISKLLIYVSLPIAAFILFHSIKNAIQGRVNPRDRVGFFIFLAPISIYGLAASTLWSESVFSALVWLALLLFIILIGFLPWMLKSGFTPAWAALTFPLAAFASLMHLAAKKGIFPDWLAWGALAIATIVVLSVVLKVYHLWYKGKLAVATKAAVA